MTVVDLKTAKIVRDKEEGNSQLLGSLKDKNSIIAIAATSSDDEYAMYVTDDLKKFDIIALLELCKLQIAQSHLEEE